MGKAVIKSSLGAGLYRVGIQFDNASVQVRLAAIATQLADIATKLTDVDTRAAAKLIEFNAAKQALNDYINATPPEDIAADTSTLNALTAQAYELKGDYEIILSEQRHLKLRKTSLEKDQSYLQNNCPDEIETDAWCVALNESLAGTTATIEIDYAVKRSGETLQNDTGVWIPATETQTTPTAPTTILQHAAAGSAHSNWFNLGIVPAAQRDSMLYRVGTISGLNKSASTCTITYDGLGSIPANDDKLTSESPIYPNLQPVVAATIEYPPCGGNAFENGDRVIVKAGNVVIGFYSNPRECPVSLPVDVIMTVLPYYPDEYAATNYVVFGNDIDCDGDGVGDYAFFQTPTKIVYAADPAAIPSDSGYTVVSYPVILATVSIPGGFAQFLTGIAGDWAAYNQLYPLTPAEVPFNGTVTMRHQKSNSTFFGAICTGDLPVMTVPAFNPAFTADSEVSITLTSEPVVLRDNSTGATTNYYATSNFVAGKIRFAR